jgi:hypothetical protein
LSIGKTACGRYPDIAFVAGILPPEAAGRVIAIHGRV